MDTPPGGSSTTETLISACTAMLSRRRFSTARGFALRLPNSLPAAQQILAISDVLSAADSHDWYSVLRLRPAAFSAGNDLPRQQFKKLALLIDPNTNAYPFSSEALTSLIQAWHVLSNPQRRQLYDLEIMGDPPPPELQRATAAGGGTFWTACPYCWNMYEYEDAYEDCALRCEVCRKVFHGVAVKPPVREETVVVEGQKRVYYRCNASVPLRYYEVLDTKKEEDKNIGIENFIYISDDDDAFGGEDVRNVGCERVVQGNIYGNVELQGNGNNNNNNNNHHHHHHNNNNNGKRGVRVKTVAKKVGGRKMRRQQGVCLDADGDLDLDLGDGGGELEFTQGDDGDIFVGVRFSK